jgi:excisionase family DNA binding protein
VSAGRPKKDLQQPEDLNQLFYNIYETADILGVHERTVRRLIKDNELKAFKVGRVWRISREAIEELTKN